MHGVDKPEMSRNSITPESADAQCVGVPVLGPTSGRAFAFSDGQTPSMNVMNQMKLMVVSLAGYRAARCTLPGLSRSPMVSG